MEITQTGIIIKCQAYSKYRSNEEDVIIDINVLIYRKSAENAHSAASKHVDEIWSR